MIFESHWTTAHAEPTALPARPMLHVLPARTTAEATFYSVRWTSTGPYQVHGNLSIPAGDAPFPGLTPRYRSVNNVPHPNDRARYVVLSLMHRGQRLADEGFATAYPGLLTIGIDDPAAYSGRMLLAADNDHLKAWLAGLAGVRRLSRFVV
ncbi:hypothetical protein AB0E69_38530 [Kribbella sp. NPDC026611]|uniref:hypothetical protein n=1 Tax=Kribbella sp. NPDC026611 TaxID=3154911 RepID=UPI0033D4BBBF